MDTKKFVSESIAQFLLKSQSFEAIVSEDKEQDVYEITTSSGQKKLSKYLFPTIVQAIKAGSRADRLYLDSSDNDYMYEVGPLLVQRRPETLKEDKLAFYFQRTKNPGFYIIFDSSGGYLHPAVMQSKLASIVRDVKSVALLKSASLPAKLQNMVKVDEDSVIGLKCEEWPEDVWNNFKERNLSQQQLQDIKGI